MSLFTNDPLSCAIDIVADNILFPNRKDQPPIKTEIFWINVSCDSRNAFISNKLFKQIEGVTMGSPSGCTPANFLFGHLEILIFKQPSSTHPKIYLRYVNDVFAVFDDDMWFFFEHYT